MPNRLDYFVDVVLVHGAELLNRESEVRARQVNTDDPEGNGGRCPHIAVEQGFLLGLR